jgi:hypothetical protein
MYAMFYFMHLLFSTRDDWRLRTIANKKVHLLFGFSLATPTPLSIQKTES